MENCVCHCAFLSVMTEDWGCSSPDVQTPCTQNVSERHRLTLDLCMLFSKMMAFFRSLSAATMSDGLDKAKRKPMQMMTLESCVHRNMLYAAFLSKPPSSSNLDFSAAMAQMRTPKTAFATTSAMEYPICSPAVAVTPEIPSILMMYTKG